MTSPWVFFLLHSSLWALLMSALLGHPNPPGQSQGQAGCAGARVGQGCAVREEAPAAAAPREELRLRGRERVCSGPARKTDFASVHHPRDSCGEYV